MKIKFRAWDKENSTMLTWVQLKSEADFSWFADENLVFVQSTGLKDKNGVEIYEGDVVVYFHEPAFIKKVRGGFAIVNTKDYEYTTALRGHMKVLGNIYENPELLEVTE